ncbi:TPR-like protein, partial [Coemansia reversa NRRL 1564]
MRSSEVDGKEDSGESLSAELAPELSLGEFNHVIFANALVGQVHEAMRAYDLLLEAGLKPDQTTFANLTVAHAKGGDLETAVSMFKKLESEGLEPTIYSYGTLIRAYMEFNRVDDAFHVYEMMKKREIWPNIPVYNSLIVSCLRIGDTQRAWGVFEHMRYTIAQPDEISFSIMIHACAKKGEVEKAMNLFEEMVSNNLALSDVTFNSLIHACAVRPDYFDECFRLLGLMEGHGFQPDFYTYNTVIYACARKRNLGLARDIFRDMLKRSLNPEQEDLIKIDQVTISNMMWAYAGYLPAVKNYLRSEGAPKEVLDKHLVKLINALIPEVVPVANNQVASEAVRLMRFYLEDLKGEVNTRLLNAYLAALIKNGRFESAWRVVLGDFKKFGLAKDGWTFLRMIEMCARTRDVPSAWRVWDEYKSW